ncbi:MAG: ATP synthase F0 subunit B [Acidobacteriota bacterium]
MLPDLSIIWVILAVLILAFALDRLLFKPLARSLGQRQAAVTSALELAESAASRAQAATTEFAAKVGAARAEIYKQMDERRKAAEGYRTEVLNKTRAEIESTVAHARTELEQQTAQARARLQQDADALGREIADKVLGR